MVRFGRFFWRGRVASLTIVCALALVAPAAASPSAAEVSGSPGEIREYWTDERIASAVPADVLLAGIAPLDPLFDGVLGLGGSPSQRASAEQISNPNRGRLRTNGKVLFSIGPTDFVCSGTSVESKTQSLVTTAGHCTFAAGSPVDNWMFVPAKDGDEEPFGRWPATRLATTPQWQASEDIRYDVGMATVSRLKGKQLQQEVGARGMAFNREGNQRFRAFGYPAGAPFNGRNLYRCKSVQEGVDQRQDQPRPGRIDCDMTGGSSGGGWLVDKGRVNSVVSYGYECTSVIIIVAPCDNPEEGKLFGPYFGDEVRDLYRAEKR